MQKLARACYHRRRSVLAVWVVLLIGLSVLASTAGGVFKVQNGLPGPESRARVRPVEGEGVRRAAPASRRRSRSRARTA